MPGINNTGKPSTLDYLIGRGEVFFAELDASGKPKDFRHVGNVPEINLTVETENYDHYSSMESLRKRDLRVLLQQDMTGSMALEEINFQNMAIFFSGETEEYANPAIAGFADVRFVNDDELKVNAWYQIVDSSHNPVFGITTTNDIVVESTNDTPVALVKGTDYTVDTTGGKIFIEDTTTTQSVITAGDGLQSTLTADATAATVDRVKGLSASELNVAIRIESVSAETGTKVYYEFHKTTVGSDGDFGLITEEAAQLPLTFASETNDAYDNVLDIYYPDGQ